MRHVCLPLLGLLAATSARAPDVDTTQPDVPGDAPATSQVGVPLFLGPLQDNGGWTDTHELLPGRRVRADPS